MKKKLKKQLSQNKGFTLIEMIITIAISTVLIGIISAGIYGYMLSAYMTRVNETAKTVFLASQNYLTERKQLGNLNHFNEIAEQYGENLEQNQLEDIFLKNDPSFDFDAYLEKYSANTVRYLVLNEDDGTEESTNPIYHIVKNYLKDDELLKHTFLIEYDTKTGIVRSVFYTEKAKSLVYDGDLEDRSNVILRDSQTLRKKRQGFYGVDATSLIKYDVDVYSPARLRLVNGERLYLEWKEANFLSPDDILNLHYSNNANEAFDDEELREFLVYDLEIYRKKDDTEEKLFEITDIDYTMSRGKTLAEVDKNVQEDEIALAYNERNNTYQLLLDCIDHSILEEYGKDTTVKNVKVENQILPQDMIYCKITEKIKNHNKIEGISEPAFSNLQSANYAGGVKSFIEEGTVDTVVEVGGNGNLEEDGSSKEYSKAFSIANARQFNNMRHVANTSCFIQTDNIDWERPEADREIRTELFEPFVFEQSSSQPAVFMGTYQNGITDTESYTISNLAINKVMESPEKNVGIFRENIGTIEEIHLVHASVKGAYYVGAVTGINAGTIEGAKLENCFVDGAYYTGGLTGYNKGALKESVVEATVTAIIDNEVTSNITLDKDDNVTYGQCLGGAVGINEGSMNTIVTENKTVSGTSYLGGLVGINGKTEKGDITDCTNRNKLVLLTNGEEDTSGQAYGGVAGSSIKESTIERCNNSALIYFTNTKKELKNIGGVVGENAGKIFDCDNVVELADEKNELNQWATTCMNEVKKGKLPIFNGINVGGIAGSNEESGFIKNCSGNNLVAGYEIVGGLVGENAGKLEKVPSKESKTEGLVIATKNIAGGIVGTHISNNHHLQSFENSADVFAESVAGGIIGCNGGSGEYTFTTLKEEKEYYNALTQPNFSEVNTNATISDCMNYGFVYSLERYSGGITGINMGTIHKSNSHVELSQNKLLKNNLKVDEYKKIAKADCVGGIVGLNNGRMQADIGNVSDASVAIFANDFAGGIAGLNQGKITGYTVVQGDVYAKGNAVGGFIGMNYSKDSIKEFTSSDSMTIEGGYFVGGIIGLNVFNDGEPIALDEVVTLATKKNGSVTGKAYVGGILGYGTRKQGDSISELFESELNDLIQHVYDDYVPETGDEIKGETAIFSKCINRSNVYGERYVGGILGYNSPKHSLVVDEATNYGDVKIIQTNQVKDHYYFIGGITGRNSAGGIINECVNDGSVQSPSIYLGGICEVNEGYIQSCTIGKEKDYGVAGITGENSVGGIVGLNSGFVVCCNTSQYATIKGKDNTGGMVGTNTETGVITGDDSNLQEVLTKKKNILSFLLAKKDSKCISSGSVTGADNTGGIVGLNMGVVEKASVEGSKITGKEYVGGFIGNNEGRLISDNGEEMKGLVNHAEKVVGYNQVGGIVGKHNSSKIEECKNYGLVMATAETGATGCAGGITGSVETGVTVLNCSNFGLVVSKYYQAGGITGNNKGVLELCKNYGSVTGAFISGEKIAVGGIVGVNEKGGEVNDCSSLDSGEIPREEKEIKAGQTKEENEKNEVSGVYQVGGIIGYNLGQIKNEKEGNLVSINIRVEEIKIPDVCYIGGVIGKTYSGCTDVLKNYTYKGTIEVSKNASSAKQNIGGIISELEGRKGAVSDKGMVLDNCIFAGKIIGYGNESGNGNGVGGLAGVSRGTIKVYAKDGIYTSTTKGSIVEGNTNVGGIVGSSDINNKIELKKEDEVENDIFYTNLATVSGGFNVGGFYGRMYRLDSLQEVELSYYQNGLANDMTVGTIKPNNDCKKVENIGGIVGGLAVGLPVTLHHLENYGLIGTEEETYSNVAQKVGGIIGDCENGTTITLHDITNYGTIQCGKNNIGGIAGIIGLNKNSNTIEVRVENCLNKGEILVQANNVGGIAGTLKNSTITNTNNQGSIVVTGNFNRIGGLIGTTTQTNLVESVTNESTISLERTTNGDSYIGGIIGSLEGNTTVNNAVNKSDLLLSRVQIGGGIAGQINTNGGNIKITNCINEGALKKGLQAVGGIVGRIIGRNDFSMSNNENYGAIHAKYIGGGIAGSVETDANVINADIKECKNYGDIVGALPIGKVNNLISTLGGCIGSYNANVTIKNFENYGIFAVEEENQVESVYEIGGIVGLAKAKKGDTTAINFKNCNNYGSYKISEDVFIRGSIESTGGIAGSIQAGILLESCDNREELRLEEMRTSKNELVNGILNFGGIIGKGAKGSKLIYCTNYKSVIGDKAVAKNVGGIAGLTEGLVYSCSTKNETKTEKGIVAGKTGVGGLVGTANGLECKITSIANKENTDYEYGENHFSVEGMYQVGGLVGKQKGATLYTLLNGSDVTVTLLLKESSDTGNEKQTAGGLVGYSELDNKVQGVIANCYHFGKVMFEENKFADNNLKYLGGIIGYRNSIDIDVAGTKEKKASTAIKDSFYLYAEKEYPYISESLPENAPKKQVLAVGNEPEGNYFQDKEDQQYGNSNEGVLNTKDRFCWSEDAYIKMYQKLHKNEMPTDSDNWADIKTVKDDIMHFYNLYRLPVPETGEVTSVEGYNYVLPVERLAGFCEKLEVRLYDWNDLDDDIEDLDSDKATPLWKTTVSVGFDNQLKDIGIDVSGLKEYIGKPVKVTMQAFGVKQPLENGDELTYTGDSKREVVKEFVIMPPLLTPKVELVKQEAEKLIFKVTNWEEYKMMAEVFYPMIKENVPAKYQGIYEQFLNGLQEFTIKDYYLKEENGARTNIVDNWVIPIESVIKQDGTFVLDYGTSTNFDKNKTSHRFHDWDIKAVASHGDWSLAYTTNPEFSSYRYVDSENGTCKYQIKQPVKLNPPQDLKISYTGKMDWAKEEETPSYEITFNKSTSPEEAVKHYLITVKNPNNGKIVTYEYIPEDSTEDKEEGEPDFCYVLSKETLLGVNGGLQLDMEADSKDTKLEITVCAVPVDAEENEDVIYLQSDDTSTSITTLKKEYPVEEEMTVKIKNDAEPNKLTFEWIDNNKQGDDIYFVSYKITNGNVVTEHEVGARTICEYTVDTSLYDKDCKIEFTVVKKGKEESGSIKTLNSNPVTYEKKIGEAIEQVENVKVVFSKVNGEQLYYDVTFDIPDALTEQSCNGFTIQAISSDVSGEALSELIQVPFDAKQPIRLPISADHMGKSFYAHVISLSAKDGFINSDRAVSNLVKIPIKRLDMPKELSAKVNVNGVQYDITNPKDKNAFEQIDWSTMKYQFTWNNSDMSTNCKNQYIQILVGDTVINEFLTPHNTTLLEQNLDLSKYAGQMLTVQIYNEPIESAIHLPSEPAKLQIYLPKIKLVAPTLEEMEQKFVTIKNGTEEVGESESIPMEQFEQLSYHLVWKKEEDEVDFADGYEVRVTVKQENGDEIAVPCSVITSSDISEKKESHRFTIEESTCTLTGIGNEYAGKTLKFTLVKKAEATSQYVDSDPLEVEIQLPEITIPEKNII